MIHLPERFDLNEWYLLIMLSVGTLVMFRLPKRFPLSLSILVLLFAAVVARVTDHLLAGPAHQDLYDIMDKNKIEIGDILSYLFYGPFAYFFAYLYDKWRVEGLWNPLFLVAASGMACGIEWVAAMCKVFVYKNWNLFISFTVYLLVQSLTILYLRFLRGHHPRMSGGQEREERVNIRGGR